MSTSTFKIRLQILSSLCGDSSYTLAGIMGQKPKSPSTEEDKQRYLIYIGLLNNMIDEGLVKIDRRSPPSTSLYSISVEGINYLIRTMGGVINFEGYYYAPSIILEEPGESCIVRH